MTTRIRRSEKPPRFVTEERVRRRNYPHTQSLNASDAKAHLRYRLSRWRHLAEEERIRKRELFAWIQLGRRRIGAIELHEFEISGCFDNDDVLYIMDCEEEYESRLAQVLCSALDDLPWDVMPYGSILDFRHAWTAPDPICRGLFAKAAITVIDTILPDHALMIMKAYPLEYEGQVPDGAPVQAGLEARQRAMARHYRKLFNVQQLPDPHGKEGWLWHLHPKLEKLVIGTGKTEDNPFF